MVGNITEVMQSMRNDYPLLEKAIKEALQTLLQQRPADPVLFVAEKLREVNRENRIEMEMAATKIQALGRRKRDARRVKQLRHQSHLWLRDLFVKLDIESSNSISRQKLIDFVTDWGDCNFWHDCISDARRSNQRQIRVALQIDKENPRKCTRALKEFVGQIASIEQTGVFSTTFH